MNNILITSAGRRVALVKAFQVELKKISPTSKVYTVDTNPLWSPACRVSDVFSKIPKANENKYINYLLDFCIKNSIKLIIPTIDTELIILSKSKDIFAQNNIQIIISDINLVILCRDKRKTNILFKELGINVPKLIDKLNPTFPLFIKPYDGSLSRDIHYIQNASDLTESLLNNPKLMFMEYLNSKTFQEYTIDAYFDKNNFLKCLVPRSRIEVRGGEISKGKTVKNEFYYILKEKLQYIKGAFGCLTIQFFIGKIDNQIFGIEINPRFGGGYPLSYAAGANYPEYLIREYILNETISFNEVWKENMVMLRYDSEIILSENEFDK